MDYIDASLKIINIFANMVVIATGLAAIYYVLELLFVKHRKRVAMERYLYSQSQNSLHIQGGGACTVLHLMAKLKLTEAEVFDCAFASHNIICPDLTSLDLGQSNQVMFQYVNRSAHPYPASSASRQPFAEARR